MTARTPQAGGGLVLPRYRPRSACTRRSTRRPTSPRRLRAPTQPLVPLPQRLTEVTGPLLGAEPRARPATPT